MADPAQWELGLFETDTGLACVLYLELSFFALQYKGGQRSSDGPNEIRHEEMPGH